MGGGKFQVKSLKNCSFVFEVTMIGLAMHVLATCRLLVTYTDCYQFESRVLVYISMTYNNSVLKFGISSFNFRISSKKCMATIADLRKIRTFAPGY